MSIQTIPAKDLIELVEDSLRQLRDDDSLERLMGLNLLKMLTRELTERVRQTGDVQ